MPNHVERVLSCGWELIRFLIDSYADWDRSNCIGCECIEYGFGMGIRWRHATYKSQTHSRRPVVSSLWANFRISNLICGSSGTLLCKLSDRSFSHAVSPAIRACLYSIEKKDLAQHDRRGYSWSAPAH